MDTNAKPVSLSVVPVAAVPTVAEQPSIAVPPVAVSVDTGKTSDRNRASQQAEEAARYRLVIEEGPTQGSFVYKTLDSTTGEIVRQFPREQVLRMAESGGYSAGGLIDTSA
jgi:flagellar protein FlaG